MTDISDAADRWIYVAILDNGGRTIAASGAGDKNRQKRHVVDAKHKQPPARKKRSKAQAKPRLKAYWAVYTDKFQRVALFEYSERKKAEKAVRELDDSKKISHFVRLVKVTIE